MGQTDIDPRSGRIIVWFVGLIALIATTGYLLLVALMLSKAKEDIASYALALAGVGPLVGALDGGLVNALTTRSGSTPDDLAKTVALTQPHQPDSQESMTAGVTPNP